MRDAGLYSLMYVDDDPQTLELFRRFFSKDYRVFTATNGAEALSILSHEAIHVLFADQRMPAMSGIQLFENGKAGSQCRSFAVDIAAPAEMIGCRRHIGCQGFDEFSFVLNLYCGIVFTLIAYGCAPFGSHSPAAQRTGTVGRVHFAVIGKFQQFFVKTVI